MSRLSHIDNKGEAHMVDVSAKASTTRTAVAVGCVTMSADAFAALVAGNAQKGDVLAAARLAGIMGAKRTADLIPLCHPLPVTKIAVDLEPDAASHTVKIRATVKTVGATGVEMEALTAVSVAALTLYDMLKAVDRSMVIGEIKLAHKSGGKSGAYDAP